MNLELQHYWCAESVTEPLYEDPGNSKQQIGCITITAPDEVKWRSIYRCEVEGLELCAGQILDIRGRAEIENPPRTDSGGNPNVACVTICTISPSILADDVTTLGGDYTIAPAIGKVITPDAHYADLNFAAFLPLLQVPPLLVGHENWVIDWRARCNHTPVATQEQSCYIKDCYGFLRIALFG